LSTLRITRQMLSGLALARIKKSSDSGRRMNTKTASVNGAIAPIHSSERQLCSGMIQAASAPAATKPSEKPQ
jgi:hypothetical protein